MLGNFSIKTWFIGLAVLAGALLLTAPQASAQTAAKNDSPKANVASNKPAITTMTTPQFTAYRGIQMGMSAEDVRAKLDHLREKGKMQDFFVFSDKESAQIFYDKDGKVRAISIDYYGADSNAPTSGEVLGADIQAKPDGSIYELKRYPGVGYWVSYYRSAGADPTVTITIQNDN